MKTKHNSKIGKVEIPLVQSGRTAKAERGSRPRWGSKQIAKIMLTLTNYCALASRLGWGAMQVDIAVPAIKRIVVNYINLVADCTGDALTPEDAVSILLTWNSDGIFDLLVEDDYTTYGTSHLHELRGEIEWFMMNGCEFIDAINEWWK